MVKVLKAIKAQEAQDKVPDKLAFYHSMLRNHWYLPSYNSSIITKNYMEAVRNGLLWCPRYDDVKIRPCPIKPPKHEFAKEIFKLNAKSIWKDKLGFNVKDYDKVDLPWLEVVLSTVCPDHEFFTKSYMPPVLSSKPD
jgi:hypothetical protein